MTLKRFTYTTTEILDALREKRRPAVFSPFKSKKDFLIRSCAIIVCPIILFGLYLYFAIDAVFQSIRALVFLIKKNQIEVKNSKKHLVNDCIFLLTGLPLILFSPLIPLIELIGVIGSGIATLIQKSKNRSTHSNTNTAATMIQQTAPVDQLAELDNKAQNSMNVTKGIHFFSATNKQAERVPVIEDLSTEAAGLRP